MSRIFLTGDTHSNIDIGKINSQHWKTGKELTKNDYLIILGDAGIIWYNNKKDNYIKKWYNEKPWTTLFIDGNHENHAALNSYPVETWKGGKVHKISDSIIHLMRGQVFDIDKLKFFTFGGANSVDKMYRVEGVSWWPEEIPSYEEFSEGISNLEKNNFEVDYILTHDCSEYAMEDLLGYNYGDSDPVKKYFNKLETTFNVRYNKWYFGHHHIDASRDNKHICLYQGIVEIKHR